MKKYFVLGIALVTILIASLLGYGVYLNERGENQITDRMENLKIPLTGAVAQVREISPVMKLDLVNLYPVEMTDVVALEGGRITQVLVDKNSYVKVGDPLFILVDEDIPLKIRQADSDILQAELQGAAQSARGEVVLNHDAAAYQNIRETIAYKPEESWNYEFGTHLNLLDGLHLDLTGYFMQIRNQQLSVFATQYGFGRMMVNAGKSYSCGIEATLRGSAFDNRLMWGATYGYTHAVFKDYTDSIAVDGQVKAVDYKDKRVPFVPEHTVAAHADYRFDVGDGLLKSVTLGANVTAQGKIWWDEENTYGQKFYATLGAHLDADLKPVTLSLWARNLTNTNYNTFAIKSSFGGDTSYFAQRGNPFQAGVDVKLHF